MAVTTIQPNGTAGLDTYLEAGGGGTTNFGTNNRLRIGHDVPENRARRGWVKYAGLSDGTIPPSANIVSAVFSIFAVGDAATNARTLRVFRVKRAVVESEATWLVFSTGNDWQTGGCSGADDVEATDIGTAAVAANLAEKTEIQVSLTPAAVQAMVAGVWANNGFLLKVDTEDDDVHYFYSSDEATETACRPKLVVTWSNGFISFF